MDLDAGLAQRVLAGLGDAVIEVDAEGRISGWHGASEQLFGYRADQAGGRAASELFVEGPGLDLDPLTGAGPAAGIDFLARARSRAGRTFEAAVSYRGMRGGGGVAVVRPMTAALDPVRGAARGRADWDRTLGWIARGLVDVVVRDPVAVERTQVVAGVLVEQARRMLPDTECLLSLVPHDRQEMFGIIAGSGEWAETLVGREWPRAATVAGLAMERKRPIETIRIQQNSTLTAELAAGGIQSARLMPLWTAAPLPDGRTAIGVLGFYRREARYFTPYERRLIKEFCRLASLLLQGAELRAAAVRDQDRLQRTIEAAYRFSRSLAPDQLFRDLVSVAMSLEPDRVTVAAVEGGASALLAWVDAGSEPVVLSRRALTPVGAADAGRLAEPADELGRLVVSDDATVGYSVAMPVADVGGARVVLTIERREGPVFPADELALLQTVASIAGLALRNARLYEEVQEAGHVKSEFLNLAAHELRTPLTVIRGYLSMLSENSFGEVPPAFAEPIELLQVKIDELARLVDDLLLAARLDAGRLIFSPRPLELNATARQAVENARAQARAAGAVLRIETARRPVVISGDPDLVIRILQSLLSNAITYGGHRPMAVKVTVRAADGLARVEVEDRGRGIDEEDHQNVFERFRRLDDERYPQRPGTGLGLYIARALAEGMGGRVELEWSEPDRGSRFVFAASELAATIND